VFKIIDKLFEGKDALITEGISGFGRGVAYNFT